MSYCLVSIVICGHDQSQNVQDNLNFALDSIKQKGRVFHFNYLIALENQAITL
jgi:hypothetical protein